MKRALVAAILVLGACGGESSEPKTSAPTTASPPAAAVAPRPAPLAPEFSFDVFAGKWKATMAGSRIKQERRSLDLPLGEAQSFTFAITEKDGAFFLDGPTPMAMKAWDRSLLGESRGVAVRLTFVPPGIAGEITRKSSDSDSLLVLEFEAERAP